MSQASRFLYPILNLAWGAGIGAAASIAVHQEGAWAGRPSTALLAAGVVVIFGAAYVVTVTVRGQRPALSGVVTVAAAAASVLGLSTLAVSAPVWVLVWAAAALVGLVAGLLQPLRVRQRVAA